MNARDDFGDLSIPFEDSIRPELPAKLRSFDCHYGGTHDHGHTACLFFVLAADDIDRLRAENAALRSAMNVLGKAARDGSDMLTFLRESEGVQSWHEDRLDDIDRCISAIETAPARGDRVGEPPVPGGQ